MSRQHHQNVGLLLCFPAGHLRWARSPRLQFVRRAELPSRRGTRHRFRQHSRRQCRPHPLQSRDRQPPRQGRQSEIARSPPSSPELPIAVRGIFCIPLPQSPSSPREICAHPTGTRQHPPRALRHLPEHRRAQRKKAKNSRRLATVCSHPTQIEATQSKACARKNVTLPQLTFIHPQSIHTR